MPLITTTARAATLRRGALGGLSALALLGAAAPAASAAKLALTYQCTYPLMGAQPLEMELSGDFPATVLQAVPSEPVELEARFTGSRNTTAGLSLLQAATIEGEATLGLRAAWPDATLPFNVRATIAPTSVPSPAQGSGTIAFTGRGTTPPITYPRFGTASISVDALRLTLTLRQDDGTPIQVPQAYPDVDSDEVAIRVPCQLEPALLDTTLIAFTVGHFDDRAPSKPADVRADQVFSESARIVWSAPAATEGVVSYRAYDGDTEVGNATANADNTLFVRDLEPQTTYTLTLKAFDEAGNASAPSDPVTFTTSRLPGIEPYHYDLAGAATLKTLTKGNVPLSGSIIADVKLATGEVTADLTLAPTTARLVTLGFLPITADVAFVSTAPTTGTLVNGVLSTNSKVRIKLPKVSLFGLQLAGGANCQTKTVSNIALKSTDASFAPLSGGSLAGTFAISDLTGCGSLTGLVSPLTAGKGNAIALKLTPQA